MDLKEIVKEKSNAELLAMVYQFDQWSVEMLEEVEAELSRRNILPTDISESKQKLIEQEKLNYSKGKEASMIGLVIGWLMVFGLFGIIIGYNYAYGKTKSKYTGEDFFKYNEGTRKNGTNLFYTSLLLTSLGLIYKLATI